MSEQRLNGKVAIVTGGGSGIGQATAIRFAEHGAKVYMLDRTPEKAEETKQNIEQAGGEAYVIECDISKPDHVQKPLIKLRLKPASWILYSPMGSTAPWRRLKRWNRKTGTKRWRLICAARLQPSNTPSPSEGPWRQHHHHQFD